MVAPWWEEEVEDGDCSVSCKLDSTLKDALCCSNSLMGDCRSKACSLKGCCDSVAPARSEPRHARPGCIHVRCSLPQDLSANGELSSTMKDSIWCDNSLTGACRSKACPSEDCCNSVARAWPGPRQARPGCTCAQLFFSVESKSPSQQLLARLKWLAVGADTVPR